MIERFSTEKRMGRSFANMGESETARYTAGNVRDLRVPVLCVR